MMNVRLREKANYINSITFFYQGRCTDIQELQMTTVLDENVHNYAGILLATLR